MRGSYVLIIAPEDDIHVAGVREALKRYGVESEWIDLANLSCGLQLTLSLDRSTSASVTTPNGRLLDLAGVLSIWWRRPRPPKEDAELDEETRAFVRGEWSHFIRGIEAFTPPLWVNSPAATRRAELKAFQLASASLEGLRVPRTRITNDPQTVRAFAKDVPNLIYKRIGPAPRPLTATKPLPASDLDRLERLTNCPTLFQERIDAECDIRVTAIGEALYATEIDSQAGASPWDWRFDHSVKFREHQLDSGTAGRLRALMGRLGLSYGAIDLRLTANGEYVFLEVNPSGQYLFVELLTGVPLSARMAELLARRDEGPVDSRRFDVSTQRQKRMTDTDDEATLIAKGTLLELYELLPVLREKSVVYGGIAVAEWVGRFSDIGKHNTRDVDLILDLCLGELDPRLSRRMIETGFYERRTMAGLVVPYSFVRKWAEATTDNVHIDFLCPRDVAGETIRGLPGLLDIGDLKAKTALEGDLALRHFETRKIQGRLRCGKLIEGEVRLVLPYILVTTKAMAFADRGTDDVSAPMFRRYKDAADLYALLAFAPDGSSGLAQLLKPYRHLPLVEKTVTALATSFADINAQGVDAVVQFVRPMMQEADLRRRVVKVVTEYLRALNS